MNQQFLKDNSLTIGGGVLLILAIAFGGNTIGESNEIGEMAQAKRAETNMANTEAALALEQLRLSKEKAEQLLQQTGTVVFVVGELTPGTSASLTPGAVVRDHDTGNPLPGRTVVADLMGAVAILDEGGKIPGVIYTGADQAIVLEAFNRSNTVQLNRNDTGALQ